MNNSAVSKSLQVCPKFQVELPVLSHLAIMQGMEVDKSD